MSTSWSTTSPAKSCWPRASHAADAFLLARILAIRTVVPLLARLPLATLARVLRPAHAPHGADQRRLDHVLRLLDLGLERPRPRPTCLTRGITRYYVLSRLGLDLALVFGIGAISG